jgi:hypothetical protein
MAYTQLQKVGLVFLSIFAFAIVYSLVSKNIFEGFADKPKVTYKKCTKDSECPNKFSCKQGKCVSNKPAM